MWIETYRGAVYPWHCDHMGHMNVMWYVGKFDEATWNLFARFGVTGAWLKASERGFAAVDQRIAYLSELLPGETLFVRSTVLEVKAKSIRFVHHMHEATSEWLAAVCQLVGVQLDTRARRSVEIPAEVADKARAMIMPVQMPWDSIA